MMDMARRALFRLCTQQRMLKAELAAMEGERGHEAEAAVIREKLRELDWLIGLAIGAEK